MDVGLYWQTLSIAISLPNWSVILIILDENGLFVYDLFVIVQGNNFRSKSWTGRKLAWEHNALKSRHVRVFCMSVQHASKSKVAIKPLELENVNDPPLNLYKPKGPYTASIVSVERIVGPKAPGETCHVVIDHGGNVPYWEGQSYGVIPPVSICPSMLTQNSASPS